MDVKDELSNEKPRSPKKTYAFGIPDHGKLPFSELSHLSPTNIKFAAHLAEKDQKNRIEHTSRRESTSATKKAAAAAAAAAAKKAEAQAQELLALEGAAEGEKGIAPCTRQDCREVVASILEVQTKNAIERDEVVHECEKMISLHQQMEEECTMIDEENKRMVIEGNMLELRLKTVGKSLNKSEMLKTNLDNEKEELSSKIMMLELEKQRTTRRSADIQAALNDIMWKGSTNLLKENPNKSNLYIKPYDAASFEEADNPGKTPYEWVVNDRMIDISERPKTVPVLPGHLRLLKSDLHDASVKSRTSTGSATLHALKKSNSSRHIKLPNASLFGSSHHSVSSDLSASTRLMSTIRNTSPAMSPIRSRTGTVRFDKPVNESSFKGYTPSGGKRTLGTASSQRLAELNDTASLGNSTAGSGGLDPVFFAERARTSWGRERKLGKVRLRADPEGYKRKMLTSLGHPGVFGVDELDDERSLMR